MIRAMLAEFKPTILFLVKFAAIYLVGNLLYGFYVTAYYPSCDPASQWVTQQSATLLNVAGFETEAVTLPNRPITLLRHKEEAIISVYEGCNGINVVIVFVAFLFAIGPWSGNLAWFALLGMLIIHITNLMRIIFLYWVTIYLPRFLYFAHKYLFTACIYIIVFALWFWWVKKFASRKKSAKT